MPRHLPDKLALLALLTASCQGMFTTPTPITTSFPEQNNPTPPIINQLPFALYYLVDPDSGPAQIFRLAQPEQEPTFILIAPDESDITDFDVSRQSRRLAYIADNRLYLGLMDSSPPMMILDGGSINSNGALFNRITSPLWSPEGNTLAFGYNGVQLYLLGTGTVVSILPDIPVSSSQPSVGAIYSPYAWAPDGSHLLVSISHSEEAILGMLNISTGSLTALPSVCCQAVWLPDSQGVYLSNPYPDYGPTGVWKYTLIDHSLSPVFPSNGANEPSSGIGWVIPASNEDFTAFYTSTPNQTEGPVSFSLTHFSLSPSGSILPLRSDQFQIKEILWAPDASLAVAVIPLPAETSWTSAGTLLLIPTSEQPAVPLAASGYNLHWGP